MWEHVRGEHSHFEMGLTLLPVRTGAGEEVEGEGPSEEHLPVFHLQKRSLQWEQSAGSAPPAPPSESSDRHWLGDAAPVWVQMSGSRTDPCCFHCSQQRGSCKTGENYFQVVALCTVVFSQANCCWGFLMFSVWFEALFKAEDCAVTGLGDGEAGAVSSQPECPLTRPLLCSAPKQGTEMTSQASAPATQTSQRRHFTHVLIRFSSVPASSMRGWCPRSAHAARRPKVVGCPLRRGWVAGSPPGARHPGLPAGCSSSLGNRSLKHSRRARQESFQWKAVVVVWENELNLFDKYLQI